MNVKIVADSSANLPALAGIAYASVPLKILAGEKEYVDDAALNVPVMLDEMDASIPEVLVILNAAIANRYFDFPCGYVEAHPDFRVIAAGNTFGLGADYEYVGRNQLDMASLDRFAMVEIDYDENIEKAVANGDTELVEFVHELRKVSAENCIRMVVSYRGISRLSKMVRQLGLCEALKTCIFKNLRKDDINVLYSAMKKKSNTYICAMELLTA